MSRTTALRTLFIFVFITVAIFLSIGFAKAASLTVVANEPIPVEETTETVEPEPSVETSCAGCAALREQLADTERTLAAETDAAELFEGLLWQANEALMDAGLEPFIPYGETDGTE